jgi:signal transduction histidine kinase
LAQPGQLHADVRGLTFTSERVELGLFVSADPELLQSAVTNLLNNAFKFTKAGGHVILRAQTRSRRTAGDRLMRPAFASAAA